MSRRPFSAALLSPPALVAALAVLCMLGGPVPVASGACINEAQRVEQGALQLPDCRAYELVSGGAVVANPDLPGRAALAGGAVAYYTANPAPDAASSAFFYLAKRGSADWSTETVVPQNVGAARFEGPCEQNAFFAPDLSANMFEVGWFEAGEPARCKRPVAVVPGEPDPYRNVFVHDAASGTNQLVNVTPPDAIPANAKFQDASDDLSHVVFGEEAKLTDEAGGGYNFYLWSDGVVRSFTYLPDGSPTSGEIVEATGHPIPSGSVSGSGFAPLTGAMSSDGRRIFFYSAGSLYLRENADQPQSAVSGGECSQPELACTVQVDASQGPGFSGGGVFWRATSDGSAVFFSDERRLTPDSTASAGKADLYRYDVGSSQLTDLTVSSGEAADVRGVSGISEDGSYLYFVANGVLAPGAAPGGCHAFATPTHCSLYLLHNGEVTFVARRSGGESSDWQEGFQEVTPSHKAASLTANISPNGRFLAFPSAEPLTGFDNTDPESGTPYQEIFLYDAGDGQLSCVSCSSGSAHGSTFLQAAVGYEQSNAASWMSHSVLDDGSVFFTTAEPLLAADVNDTTDVYEYRDGQLHLISSGDFSGNARFLDAAPNGLDVFFRSPQALVGRDIDGENVSLYDARAGGGFAEPPAPVPPCGDEGCRGPSTSPPSLALPVTAGPSHRPRRQRCSRRAGHRRCHRHGRKTSRRHPSRPEVRR